MRTATRRFALWRADIEGSVCAAPEECVRQLAEREQVTVVLEHRQHGVTPIRAEFASTLRQDVEWEFTDIVWPPDVRPGVLVTVTWQAAKDAVVVRTAALDEPMRVDGVDYFHEYDPKVVTREFDPGKSNRGQVLNAVRRQGRVFDDGSAVIPEDRVNLGRGAKAAFLLRNAVDQLIREGFLTRVEGSVDSSGYPSYPPADGERVADMLFYAPLVEPADFPGEGDGDGEHGDRRDHWVRGFVRRLPPGAHPSERQLSAHEQAVEEEQIGAGELAPGYTFVKRHHRHG
ncbi:hypothetical protein Ade02nite_81050 [Paractinoplanes deccanensis]|uniref:Uncharacterized protein n=1 Tax=Paractinoplanes deccanensis TaxID=113561 RepID=A0ABQ3YHI4_9ACTN|nr:hypothetical protein [Actinoplanes deccanensis]GID79464.1 hypothetical protein Ade02nite_81050 [Actinoplanes deccanensis]